MKVWAIQRRGDSTRRARAKIDNNNDLAKHDEFEINAMHQWNRVVKLIRKTKSNIYRTTIQKNI